MFSSGSDNNGLFLGLEDGYRYLALEQNHPSLQPYF